MTLVFVYGTLKRNCSNHSFLGGQNFVGKARTVPGYTLYEITGYPGMVRQDEDQEGVCGEIWAVDQDCLDRLDELEGIAEKLYRREFVALGKPFDELRVETYIYLRNISGFRRAGAEWFG